MAVIVRLPVPPEGAATKRRPGRPRKVIPAIVSEDDYLHEIDAARHAHVAQDDLVSDTNGHDPLRVFDSLITKIAEEAAGLALDAARVEARGGDASRTRSRRIKALLQLSALIRDRELLRREAGIPDETATTKIREMFFTDVGEVAREVLGVERGEVFIAQVRARS